MTSPRPASDGVEPGWLAHLERNPVFGALSGEARAALARAGRLVGLERGERLFARGDPGDAAYLVLAGELEVALGQPDGTAVWLARVPAGTVVGDVALLDGGARSADVAAVVRTRLLRLERRAFLAAVEAEPRAAMRLLAFAVGRLRATTEFAEQTSVRDVGARLAQTLLSEPGPNRRSQAELAQIVGASRETVNRRLALWRARALVALTPQGLRVLDPAGLRAAAGLVPEARGGEGRGS